MLSFVSFLVLLSLFIVSCQPTARCNKPYILVGTSCCLDQNDNSICDSDEKELPASVEEPQEIEQTFTINDLQADIGNVLGGTVFLTKDQRLDYAQVYSNKVWGSKFFGTYGLNLFYYNLVDQKPQIVIEITNEEHYLNNKDDFKNFVTDHKDIFIQTALNSKQVFEDEFKEGELPKFTYIASAEDEYTSEKAKYLNHAELSSTLFEDSIYYPETVSGNLAEIRYIRVNNYEVNVTDSIRLKTNSKPKYTRKMSNINYGQSIVLQCSPNLIIALSVEDYGSQAKNYERNYDRNDLTKDFFSTPINSYYVPLINNALALQKMCEQRYQFTYIRER